LDRPLALVVSSHVEDESAMTKVRDVFL